MNTQTRVLTVLGVTGILALPNPASAADFTVGADGTYATVAEGLAAAIADGGGNVLIEQGEYTENLVVPDTFTAGTLHISGGWDNQFSFASNDSSMTVISGGSSDTVLHLDVVGTDVTVKQLTLREGLATQGGGIWVHARGAGTVMLEEVWLMANQATSAGAGLYAVLGDTANLTALRSWFAGNTIENADATVQGLGAGVYISASDASSFSIGGEGVAGNSILLGDSTHLASLAAGAGLFVSLDGTAQGTLSQMYVRDNAISGQITSSRGSGLSVGGGGGNNGSLTVERVLFSANDDDANTDGNQIHLPGLGNLSVLLRDSSVVKGNTRGLGLSQVSTTCSLDLVNLTIADNGGLAALCSSTSGTTSLANVLVHGNGTDDLTGCPSADHSLVGVDPLFTDRIQGNYVPLPGSPAIDTGNDSPAAGLGTNDLNGQARILGAHVDIGALEGRGFDAQITITEDADPVLLGNDAGYDITVHSTGPEDGSQASVAATVPGGLTASLSLVSGSGSCAGTTCTIGTLTAGATWMMRLVVTPQTAGDLDVSVAVTATGLEPNKANNSASASTLVEDPAADAGAGLDAASGSDAATGADASVADAGTATDAAVASDASSGSDTGAGADAAMGQDAGVGTDASSAVDASTGRDSSTSSDAGVGTDTAMGTDAATGMDTFTGTDATTVADAATTADSATDQDSSTGTDTMTGLDSSVVGVDATVTGQDSGAAKIDPDAGGCGCAQSTAGTPATLVLTLALIFVLRRHSRR
ncbi:MAG: DUF11 domain-containing protein [Pseudomonadota bacterium]